MSLKMMDSKNIDDEQKKDMKQCIEISDSEDKDSEEDNQILTNLRTGLVNSGNDCFINSAIQCLAVSPFIHEFIKRYREEDNKMVLIINKYKLGKLKADEIQEYIKKLLDENKNIIGEEKRILKQIEKYSGDIFIYTCCKELVNNLHSRNYKNISCQTLISVAKEITVTSGFEHLFTGEQNDPHEFLAFLLDKMHNSKSSEVKIELPAHYDTLDPYYKLYLKHLKTRFQNDFSMFVKNFYYYILNCVECSACNNQTLDASPNDIMCVSLPYNWKSNNNIRLEECIQEMFSVEDIEYKCEKCGNTENNRIDKKLLTKPKTLIIKIKKYAQIGRMLAKVNKMVHYPETISLKDYFCGVEIQDYHLYGVINHIGNIGGGHYYSFIKDYNKDYQFENKWYLCNDTNVKEISLNEVMQSNNAYMLFYHSNN